MRETLSIHSKQPIDDVSDGRCANTSLCDFGSGKWVNPRAIKKPLTDSSNLFGGILRDFLIIFQKGDVQKSQAASGFFLVSPIIQPSSSPGPIPKIRRFSSSAAVAEFRHTTRLLYSLIASWLSQSISVLPVSIYAANRLSNSLDRGPVVIHPLRRVAHTSSISSSEISGGLKEIVRFG